MERRELLGWLEVQKLIDMLLAQFDQEFSAMVMITRGGIMPGGMLSESMNMQNIYTASVDFPAEMETSTQTPRFLSLPTFLEFPKTANLKGRNVLVVDDVWGSGRTITSVRQRIVTEGGKPYTCVMHFNPYRSLFGTVRPDYYAAITDAYIVYPWEADRGFQTRLFSRAS
mgnify:CR=1 FL=1|jgi:hypothetical protein